MSIQQLRTTSAKCHQRRKKAESLLKYNYFIDNMPTSEVGQCPDHTLARMSDMALNSDVR